MGISAGIILYYSVIPLVLLLSYGFGNDAFQSVLLERKLLRSIIQTEIGDTIISSIIVCVVFALFSFSYNSKVGFSFGNIGRNCKLERKTKQSYQMTLVVLGNITLVLGGFCTLFYMLSFGSISKAISLSGYIRGFTVSATRYISYFASIMIIPAGIVVISPWCFLLGIDYNGGLWKKIKFLVSIILSMLFLIVKAGRAPLLIFLISFFVPFLIKKFRHPWLILLLGACIGMPIIDILDALFDNATVTTGYNFTSYIVQFAYPYRTFTCIFKVIETFGIRWGQDFITSFLGLIPGLNFDSSWRIISEYFGGTGWKTGGSTPTDLISFFILEFHIFGVLCASALGLLCRDLDMSLFCLATDKNRTVYGSRALGSFCLLNSLWFVSTADFESLVRNLYFLSICIVLLFVTRRIKNSDEKVMNAI